jgi:hypothetical protein
VASFLLTIGSASLSNSVVRHEAARAQFRHGGIERPTRNRHRSETALQYVIEFNRPNSLDDVLVNLTSRFPFMTFEPGDIVEPAVWDGTDLAEVGVTLLIVGRQHFVSQTLHKTVLFTTSMASTCEFDRSAHETPCVQISSTAIAPEHPKRTTDGRQAIS